jgi:mRNA deadenylase 3'-5' endonuclease subunit Ccr4
LSYYSLVGQNNDGILRPCDKCNFRLNKPIYSAYFELNKKEPDVTNNGQVHFRNKTNPEPRFIGTLDYIFVSDSRIQVQSVINLPSREDIEKIDVFPNATEPSDHLLIGACLKIIN